MVESRGAAYASMAFFRYSESAARKEAFIRMGRHPENLNAVKGLRFYKLMGTGGQDGFGLWPDWSTYALLVGWDDLDQARQQWNEHPVFDAFRSGASEETVHWLRPFFGHGSWGGSPVFYYSPERPIERIAVLTRARIKPYLAPLFWSRVGKVSRGLSDCPGLIFAKGVGTLPAIEQATFSVWKDEAAVLAYAYGKTEHKPVVKATRKIGWYSEELFARFECLEIEKKVLMPALNSL